MIEGATRVNVVMPDAKAFDTLRAQAAIAGYSCCCTPLGNIIIWRHRDICSFNNLELASEWLESTKEAAK